MTLDSLRGHWALILGASSGFGEAAALELARAGLNIFGVHMDRRATLARVDAQREQLRALGREERFFNVNAADPEKRAEVMSEIQATLSSSGGKVQVLMHSLAFGTLRPLVSADPKEQVSAAQLTMTLDVMAHTLVYWTQALVGIGSLEAGGRIFAMTSAGDVRVIPNYGPVSAAKAALDAYVRQLAVELAPRGVAVNGIRAGVANTPSMQKIPGANLLMEGATRKNPYGRLTTPEDVAQAMVALCLPGTGWMTGNILGIDGGEEIMV